MITLLDIAIRKRSDAMFKVFLYKHMPHLAITDSNGIPLSARELQHPRIKRHIQLKIEKYQEIFEESTREIQRLEESQLMRQEAESSVSVTQDLCDKEAELKRLTLQQSKLKLKIFQCKVIRQKTAMAFKLGELNGKIKCLQDELRLMKEERKQMIKTMTKQEALSRCITEGIKIQVAYWAEEDKDYIYWNENENVFKYVDGKYQTEKQVINLLKCSAWREYVEPKPEPKFKLRDLVKDKDIELHEARILRIVKIHLQEKPYEYEVELMGRKGTTTLREDELELVLRPSTGQTSL